MSADKNLRNLALALIAWVVGGVLLFHLLVTLPVVIAVITWSIVR